MAGRVAYYGGIVKDGLILDLDAAKKDSYPRVGTTWNDISGNANNGTLVNGPTFDPGNGGSLVFNGTTNYVNCNYMGNLRTDTITFSFYAKHNGPRDSRRTMLGLSDSGNAAYNTYTMQIWDSDSDYLSFIGDGTTYTSYGFVVTNTFQTWNHFVAIISPTNIKNYCNGQLMYNTNGITLRGSFDRIWLGTRINQYWNGWISGLQVYNRALSAQEVLQNFNATKNRYGL